MLNVGGQPGGDVRLVSDVRRGDRVDLVLQPLDVRMLADGDQDRQQQAESAQNSPGDGDAIRVVVVVGAQGSGV